MVESDGFQINQKYESFKCISSQHYFLRGSIIVLTVTTAMQETVQGFLESPHPASLTCPGIKFRVFVISQSTWVQNIFKEEREI